MEKPRNAWRDTILMRMAVLQHVPFEGPAAIADWAVARGVHMTVTSLFQNEPLPALDGFDMLTVMGGPMSANDEAHYSWLGLEIALVRDAIGAGKTVFGVCLGAQIIAKALGARVYAAPQKEIGWFPVERTASGHAIFDGVPTRITVFHWHGETFDLPAGAAHLAQTFSTPNQGFAFGDRVLGLQFHMEATAESVASLLENAAGEIGGGAFEQAPDAILSGVRHCAQLRPLIGRVLDNLTGKERAGRE
ncbi:MAG: type 1 glutamine amidotransferase [Rhodomicrobium sp.]